ncbi:MAG: S-layer homology domain-containing protein, partial [Planctomycetes bacterium]|nr:S-layer homology domain-containing protein [Planctomycetota bacterium]
ISRALALGDEQVPTGPAQASFPDVLADHWAYDYVEYALSQNVVAGYEDGLYHPAGSVDRAQMAVFIARAICGGEEGVPSPGLRPIFSDVTDSNEWSWCYTHVQYLGSHGIVSGYPGGLYHPEYLCSRDQMAVYIARAFGLAM